MAGYHRHSSSEADRATQGVRQGNGVVVELEKVLWSTHSRLHAPLPTPTAEAAEGPYPGLNIAVAPFQLHAWEVEVAVWYAQY